MAYTTIDDSSAYFHIQLYVGNESTNAITNNANAGNFQPDWWWGADRTSTSWNSVYDSSRGTTKQLNSNVNNSEYTVSTGLTSFDSDGFTLGSHDNSNGNSENHVAWQWKANGGTTASNTDGSITSTVQANTTAGFSIVTWTGNGSTATIGHGLGATPQVVILKSRDNAHDWFVAHNSMHSTPWVKYLTLHTTNGLADDVIWNDTAPTSTVFSVGNYASTNGNTVKFVAYCFAEVQGYSKFGSYKGNGSTDGPFAYTGFKPAWVMIKRSDNTSSWHMWDNKREDYEGNPNDSALRADADGAENDTTDYSIDFLSNGFKLRNASDLDNNSSGTYIYMAFAEHPFVSSEGVPTTAR